MGKSVLIVLFLSQTSFALTNEELATICLPKGKEKIQNQAQALGCEIDLENVMAFEVDNRWYRPSKYIRYSSASGCNGDEPLTTLVEYFRKKCY